MSNITEIVEIIMGIGKDSKELDKLLKLKNFEEIYGLFKSRGYAGNLDMLKEGVEELVQEGVACLKETELTGVAGGNLKENLTKTTSLGMASLLMLGASPISSKASAQTPENGRVNVLIKTGGPIGLKNLPGSGKLPFIPLVKGDNFVKAAGIIAAVLGAGVLGYGAHELQDRISKPKGEPKGEEKQVQTDEEFIKMHLGVESLNYGVESKKEKIANCIKNISEILGNKPLNKYVYSGYKIEGAASVNEVFRYLCQVVVAYVCGNSKEYKVKYTDDRILGALIIASYFSSEFKECPEKAKKARQCIGHIIDYAKTVLNVDAQTISTIREAVIALPKFASHNVSCDCEEFLRNNLYAIENLSVVSELYKKLREKVSVDAMRGLKIKIDKDDKEYTLEECIMQNKLHSHSFNITVGYGGESYKFRAEEQLNNLYVVTG